MLTKISYSSESYWFGHNFVYTQPDAGIDTADESVLMLNKRAMSLFLSTFTVRVGVISTQAGGDVVECRPVLMLHLFS
jgi:hypothetical protein